MSQTKTARKAEGWISSKWMRMLLNISIFLLFISAVWGIRNQHKFEAVIKERAKINQQYSELVDQMKMQNEVTDRELKELRDRIHRYLDHLEGEIQGVP